MVGVAGAAVVGVELARTLLFEEVQGLDTVLLVRGLEAGGGGLLWGPLAALIGVAQVRYIDG